MISFLEQVARIYYAQHADDLSDFLFVFPNRRAGVFFQRYLAKTAGKPLLSPQITTINNLFGMLSESKLIDRTSLLLRLYQIYLKHSGVDESFDSFFYWGDMLLNDFDDLDKYLVDAQKMFTSVEDLKEIEAHFAYLEQAQIDLITRFWSHFIPAQSSTRKQNFLKTWGILYPVYQELRSTLQAEGLAYEGMLFREVAQRIDACTELPFKQVVFVGLNALTSSERLLLKALHAREVADFYWDYQSPFLQDEDNRASFFTKSNLNDFPSRYTLSEPEEPVNPIIEVIGVPSAVGQTKCAYALLEQLVANGDITDPAHAINTAVVLPDENLLMPMLYGVPESIETVNVTMGYGLSNTPIAGLMKFIFDLQLTCKWEEGKASFYYQSVLALLNHRYLTTFCEDKAKQLIQEIREKNFVYIAAEQLAAHHELLQLIFKPVSTPSQVGVYIKELLEYLQGGMADGEEDSYAVSLSELEKEFIFHYYLASNRLGDLISQYGIECSLQTYFRILAQLTLTITIPFRGEPLSGLQVMGVLETRGLDFDQQIILSMNEGVFPSKSVANSFIPHHIRKGFGMSTYEHQDAIFAYHFYRMISRAKHVYLLYDTRSSGLQTGEVSRYVHQLKYHYCWPLIERTVTSDFQLSEARPVFVQKTPEVMQRLHQYAKGGKRSLSASAITTYLSCPLQFYFQYVEMVREPDVVTETLESNTFGTIFHEVMQELYKPFVSKLVTPEDLLKLLLDTDRIKEQIAMTYKKYFHTSSQQENLAGYNILIAEVLYRYVQKVLQEDQQQAPFLHVASEMQLKTTLTLDSGVEVQLKGIVDRVDEKNGSVQIIDYKTGKGMLSFKEMKELFVSLDKDWPKAVMQVFFYGLLYQDTHRPGAITPKIYFLRHFFQKKLDTTVSVKGTSAKGAVAQDGLPEGELLDFLPYLDDYKQLLVACLGEMFDVEQPFVQTEHESKCMYCPMATLCKR